MNYGSGELASFLDFQLVNDNVGIMTNGVTVNSSFGCIYNENNFDEGIWGTSVAPNDGLLD